ncbi:hypothetical protein Poli38472_002382 [Pythium oligandrum]|uniref:Uncharacterized protein n=1 Tax=Pythium oligandrum TaxID=41045 RepID=A0A8K1CH41_PYTOL|nr:hypothetical protein Poli38472_002382 [Pythium oligandrum]|eukprot:TMW63441.1 hypothetical protein Poli38472_002382 [Pythium oligandrum]
MSDVLTLQEQLKDEKRHRQRTEERARELQRQVELLHHDVKRCHTELETVRLLAHVVEEEVEMKDLVQHNLALREQVQSLKSMVQALQRPGLRGEGGKQQIKDTTRGGYESEDDNQAGERRHLAGNGAMSSGEMMWQDEAEHLYASLAAKEAQVQSLHQQCASWEQQVIELKFEIQALKHESKEREEVTKSAQHSIVRQESCPNCKSKRASDLLDSFKREKKALSAAISPRMPRTDLEHYKSLAHLRGLYWLECREEVESLVSKLSQERKENVLLRNKIVDMENQHRPRADLVEDLQDKLSKAVSCCEVLQTQLVQSESVASEASTRARRLQSELDAISCQYQIDKRRSSRIILDLRGELNKQLMDLEQLHNASILFSPRNSRGIDRNRRIIVESTTAA